MTRIRAGVLRRLLMEQLTERLAFHADALLSDESLLFTSDGYGYYIDPPPLTEAQLVQAQSLNSAANKGDGDSVSGQPHLMDGPNGIGVPFYHSNPNYPKKIYLDFDGHVATGTAWNNQIFGIGHASGPVITGPAFTLDDNAEDFSAELGFIQDVWARVSEDFAPFQVDVTTEEPAPEAFTQGNQAMRVVFTSTVDPTSLLEWYPVAGGVAILNSWTFTDGSPCWVFFNWLPNDPKHFAEAASHEVGHTLNLMHDGLAGADYYYGHGSGATGWAPIMGVGYNSSLTQWSNGEYEEANNHEDDLAIISSKLPFIPDDHGDTLASATPLSVGTNDSFATSGLITTRTDVDAIRFATQAGTITLNVDPFDYETGKANLDAKLKLLNSAGATVAEVDNIAELNSTLTIDLAKGFYTLVVDGAGRPATGEDQTYDQGYSDYGSIGRYSVSGSIVPNAAPVAVNDSAIVSLGGSVLIDVLANDTDPNNDLLSILSVGAPASGTAVIEAGKIRYTPGALAGLVTFSYTIVDELGLTADAIVSVTVNTPPSDITLSSTTVIENAAGATVGNLTVIDPDAGDTHTFSASDSRFEVVGGVLKLKAGVSLDYETTASVDVSVTAQDSANSSITKSFTITVVDLPELVGGVILGDGTAQRSLMQKVTVTIDGVVDIASGAFTVIKRGPDGGVVTTAVSPVVNGAGQTVVTLTFSGPFTRNASGALSDGYYQLTIDGTKITRAGQSLDVNLDGQGGDVSTVGTSEADGFFALFGDTNGDALVGVAEFGQFRSSFGKVSGESGYNELFDYELDGAVGVSDFGQFRSRFGKAKMNFV